MAETSKKINPYEKKCVEYLEQYPDFSCWAVFGLDSGFCYRVFDTKKQAEQYLQRITKQDKKALYLIKNKITL